MSISLDPDQARHFVGLDLDPNSLQKLSDIFLEKVDFEKCKKKTKKYVKLPSRQIIKPCENVTFMRKDIQPHN